MAIQAQNSTSMNTSSTTKASMKQKTQAQLPENLIQITTSPNSSDNYSYFQLANSLPIVWIHNPNFQKTAFSMAVRAGSYFDPPEYQGLAHLLEHSVFLGSEKFPEKEGFFKFVGNYGGQANAYTSDSYVVYFFDIDSNAFKEGTERFAGFFTRPLFQQEAVSKERNIVQSEFDMNSKHELRKFFDLKRQVYNPEFPGHLLSIGTKDTLDDTPHPISKAISDHFATYYVAQNLSLAIASPLPLEQVYPLLLEEFGAIKSGQELPLDSLQMPLYRKQVPLLVKVKTFEVQRDLRIFFEIPFSRKNHDEENLGFIAHTLGHEAEGSLIALLREKNLALELSAGISQAAPHANFDELSINISLTESGLQEWQAIAGAVYELVARLKDFEYKKLIQETKIIAKAHFDSAEQRTPTELAIHASNLMQEYPKDTIADMLLASQIPQALNQTQLKQIINKIDPSRSMVFIVSQDQQTDKQTDYYKTDYSEEKISLEDIAQWRKKGKDLLQNYQPPQPNPFIVEDQTNEASEETGAIGYVEFPNAQQINYHQDEHKSLWLAEKVFPTANGYLQICLSNTDLIGNRKASIALKLIAELFDKHIESQLYDAKVAGYSIGINASSSKLCWNISGFPEKLDLVSQTLVKSWLAFEPEFASFSSIHRQYKDDVENLAKRSALQQLFSSLNLILNPLSMSPQETLDLLGKSEDFWKFFLPFVTQLKSQLDVRIFYYGHNETFQANNLYAAASKLGKVQKWIKPYRFVRQINQAQQKLYMDAQIAHPDTALIYYIQEPQPSYETLALNYLLGDAMSESFFASLRTEQELGYVVYTTSYSSQDWPGIIMAVQSNRASASEVKESVEKFLKDFQMSVEEFEKRKLSVLTQITENPKGIDNQARYFYREIDRMNEDFDYRQSIINALTKIDFADFSIFLRKFKERTGLWLFTESEKSLEVAKSQTLIPEDLPLSSSSFITE